MSSMPSQVSLQQAHARRVSGEELEVFGKHAANQFLSGKQKTLTEAVVETVKHAGLSPEQVKRVVEFTNQSAYYAEFQKEGQSHKYINFHGGPANPSEVLKDLNDGGGGTVFDRGIADYKTAPHFSKTAAAVPQGLEKTASAGAPESDALALAFSATEEPVPFANPMGDVEMMRDKLASMRDILTHDRGMLELQFLDICDELYGHVKEAALEGRPLGHIIHLWSMTDPNPGFVKAAFQRFGDRLVADGAVELETLADSFTKTASGIPNMDHPLVHSFRNFCGHLTLMAEKRAEAEVVDEAIGRLDLFVKKAAGELARLAGEGGLIPKAWKGAKGLAAQASPHVADAVGALAGPTAGALAGKATQYIPEAAAAFGAKELYDRGVKYGPGQIPLRYAKSHIPGTREYYAREIGLQQGFMPM